MIYKSKTILVDAIQYAEGTWKVVDPDLSVENLNDSDFKAKYEPLEAVEQEEAKEEEEILISLEDIKI